MINTNTKQCRKCNLIKPLTEFDRNRSQKDGCQCYCKNADIRLTKPPKLKNRGRELETNGEGPQKTKKLSAFSGRDITKHTKKKKTFRPRRLGLFWLEK